MCDCDLKLIGFQPTCYDKFTAMIVLTVTIEHDYNISMDDVIAKQVNKSGSSAILVQSGLVICLDPECKIYKTNNTSTTHTDDKNSLPLIVGPVGALCGIIILLLIMVTVVGVIYRRYICIYIRRSSLCLHYYTCTAS